MAKKSKGDPATTKALIEAAKKDDVKAIEQLLSSGADVNARDDYDRTPLYVAADAGSINAIKRLLEAKADIEARDFEGRTPFLAAIGKWGKKPQGMRLLAQAGADVKAKDEYDRDAISIAKHYESPEVDAVMMEFGLIDANGAAMIEAAASGDVKRLKELLAGGASVDATDDRARTALYMSVSRQQPAAFKLLLEAGADVNKAIGEDAGIDQFWGGRLRPCPKCGNVFTAMTGKWKCPECGHAFEPQELWGLGGDSPAYALSTSTKWTPLLAAARLGEIEMARQLLDRDADVDAGPVTPLMCAIHYEHLEVAKLLIDRDADVNAECEGDDDEITALAIAATDGNGPAIDLLLRAGAKTKNADATRLVAAARGGDVATVQSLLKRGVNPNDADPFTQHTPIFAAAGAGQPRAIEALLKAGASTAPPRKGAGSPLLLAVARICEGLDRGNKTADDVPRYVETVKLLIDAGASVQGGMLQQTPLSMAKNAGCKPLIELLEKALAAEKSKKPTEKPKAKKK